MAVLERPPGHERERVAFTWSQALDGTASVAEQPTNSVGAGDDAAGEGLNVMESSNGANSVIA